MSIRIIFSGSQQIIQEKCEHCEEFIRTIHISQIATVKDNDPRTVKIRDASNTLRDLKTRVGKIREISSSFKSKGLLDTTEADDAVTKKQLKYGMRPEAMCSESIDIETGITASYCFRTTNTKFLAKTSGSVTFNAKFNDSEETLAKPAGTKIGMDRKGNIIRMKRFKKINMDTGIPEADSLHKKKGAFKTSWFRALRESEQNYLVEGAQALPDYVRRYGDAVKDMTVVDRYRNRAEMITDVNRNGGELR